MKINHVTLSPYKNNVSNNKSKQSIINQTIPNNNLTLPKMPINYMGVVNFRGGLDWDEINNYSDDLGKRIRSKRNVTALAEVYKGAEGITRGRGLPEEWTSRIEDIDNFDKDSFIKEYGEIFAKERKFADVDKLQEETRDLFLKHKIIDEETPFSVKYIGHGFQAWAYKVQVGDNDDRAVVTKLFKRKNNYLQNHGNHTEQNLAEYVKNYAGDETEFINYYLGDTKNGLMLVNYISPTKKKIENVNGVNLGIDFSKGVAKPEVIRVKDLEDIGIAYADDFPKNRINGILCDYGGIITASNLMGNRTAQDVHRYIKYARTDEKKVERFNEIYATKDDSDEFKDKAIGLVHAIKYLPEEMQPQLYEDFYKLGSHRVNISLIQNIKHFNKYPELKGLSENLVDNAVDVKELETIAKEIRHIPEGPRHRFFDNQADTKHSAVIKYLARGLNTYYRNLPNRKNIYSSFLDNSDTYSGISLINSMRYMSSSRFDEYFERFYQKEDPIINIALARSLELLDEDPKLQKKWIDKLMELDDENVKAGLCESVEFVDRDNMRYMFERLLPTKDNVSKEFLAKNITMVPHYATHPEWVEELLADSDNMVKGTLINSMRSIKDDEVKQKWAKIISKDSDDTVKAMLADALNQN